MKRIFFLFLFVNLSNLLFSQIDSLNQQQTDSIPLTEKEILAANKAFVSNIIKDYTNAIGGEKKIKKFKNVVIKTNIIIENVTYNIVKYYEYPDKMTKIMSSMGSRIEKVIYDGNKGRRWGVQGYKIYEKEELDELQYEATIFLPLFFDKYKFALTYDTTEYIDGNEAHRISAITKNEKLHQFHFSALTGHLIRWTLPFQNDEAEEELLTIDYSDFKMVDEYEFPHEMIYTRGDLKMKFKVTLITINEKLENDIFMLIDK